MPQFSLPASLLRQHLFCPRIPFFNEVMSLNPSDRKWQQQGTKLHQRQEMLSKRRNLSRYQIENGQVKHQVQLQSETLGIHGRCDALVLADHEIYPIEFKLAGTTPTRAQITQLVAYGVMAEQHFALPCRTGFILFGDKGKTVKVEISEQARAELNKVIKEIQHNLNTPLLPNSSASAPQCGQCEYLNFCGDRN